jgi:hypothetical protein
LTLSFSHAVSLSQVNFYNADHGTTFGNNASWELILGDGTTSTYKLGTNFAFDKAAVSDKFTFVALTPSDVFYVGGVTVSAVPEPTTYGMLLAGVALVGVARRRKNAR